MPSDLATALVSGQNPGLFADPMLAAIAPQLQMGQALSTQGMSTAPAYPAQALGRLGQALAGAYLTHDAQQQLTGLNAGSAESLQKIFPEGTPMGDALRSPSPMVKMLAMQNAGKSLLLNSETKKLGPGDVQVAPSTPVAGGAAVATGSPTQAAAVEAAKNVPLIARAGGEAKVKAPYEAGGTVVVPGPQGPVSIPATAATRAAIQPPVGQGAGAAAIGVTGEPVQTPEFKGDVQLHEAGEKAMGGIVAQAIEGGGRATYDKLHALDTMHSALIAGGNNILTGPLAERGLKAKQLLDSLSLDSSGLTKGMAESEIVQKMNAQLSSASAKAMTGRPTQAEFLIWMKNNPGLLTSKQGTVALINVLRQQAQQDIELSKLAQDRGNWKTFPQVAEKFYQDHPLTNPLTNKPMRDEIAAARAGQSGGTAAPAAPAAPSAGATRPGPPAGTIFNNHQFLGGENIQSNWQLLKGDRQ